MRKVSVSCLLSGPRGRLRVFVAAAFLSVLFCPRRREIRMARIQARAARFLFPASAINKYDTHIVGPSATTLFVAARRRYRVASMHFDDACAVAWLETRALRRWMQKSQDGDPFAVHTLRGRKCVANDAMRSTTAAHDAKRIGCATRTEKCSRGRGASALLARTGRRRRDACQAPSPRQRPTPSPR